MQQQPNKKLNKTLLPKPQKNMIWKNRTLRINTQQQNQQQGLSDLDKPLTMRNNKKNSAFREGQNSSINNGNKFDRKDQRNYYANNSQYGYENSNINSKEYNNSNFQNRNNQKYGYTTQQSNSNKTNIKTANNTNKEYRQGSNLPIVNSQLSLQEKQFLTFAAQSNQSQRAQQQYIDSIIQNNKNSQMKNTYPNQNRSNYMMTNSVNYQSQNLSKKQQNPNSQNNNNIKNPSSISNSSLNNNNSKKFQQKNIYQPSSPKARSSSKNKQHKIKIYQHYINQKQKGQQFVAYSVIIKESKSGMFSNQKLLVLNTLNRQLMYFSKLPKSLPFQDYKEMKENYLDMEQPKEMIDLDKVRKFSFLPAKGNIAQIQVTYLSQKNQRKNWKLGMGTNANMNEWMELVNEVFKKQHYSAVKSQIKYPPKPKKQLQVKQNPNVSSFTKTLKQQVVPKIKQNQMNKSFNGTNSGIKASTPGVNSSKIAASISPPAQKQYIVPTTKFVNTKQYLIDLDDVQQQDIFYVPPPVSTPVKTTQSKVFQPVYGQQKIQNNQNQLKSSIRSSQKKRQQQQISGGSANKNYTSSSNNNNNKTNNNKTNNQPYNTNTNTKPSPSPHPPNSIYIQQPHQNSKFQQQLKKKQQLIISQHQNRIRHEYSNQKPSYQQTSYNNNKNKINSSVSPHVQLTQKLLRRNSSSGERLFQTTHKDLNINIDSRLLTDQDYDQFMRQQQKKIRRQQATAYQQQQQQSNQNQNQKVNNNSNNNGDKKIRKQQQLQLSNEYRNQLIKNQKLPNQKNISLKLKNLSQQQHQQQYYQQQQIPTAINNSSKLNNRYGKYHNKKYNQQQQQLYENQLQLRNEDNFENNNRYKNNLQRKKNNNSNSNSNRNNKQTWSGSKVQQAYILNFNPASSNNNWFRLWLEAEKVSHKLQIYTSFIKSSQNIVQKFINNPQSYLPSFSFTQNNTHINFNSQNITFKLPYKLPLPQGLTQFLNLTDFIKSQQFYSNLIKYQTQLQNEFNNYDFILKSMIEEFNNDNEILSMPIYMPMCCMVQYKGIRILCKANIQNCNLKVHKVVEEEYHRYEKEMEYIEEKSNVRFIRGKGDNRYSSYSNTRNNQQKTYDLYKIYLPSYQKSIIYMDNLKIFLPLIKNPLIYSTSKRSVQISSFYIQNYVKRGIISHKMSYSYPNEQKDILQIQNHSYYQITKRICSQKIINNISQISTSQQLHAKVLFQIGVRKEWLGLLYNQLSQNYLVNNKQSHSTDTLKRILLSQIILTQYTKICKTFFMKQFLKDLSTLIDHNGLINRNSNNQNSNNRINKNNDSQSNKQFSHSYISHNSKTIKNLKHALYEQKGYYSNQQHSYSVGFTQYCYEILHYVLYKNTKIWNVLLFVIKQKYRIKEFQGMGNSQGDLNSLPVKREIQEIFRKIDLNYLVLNLLDKMGVSAKINLWKQSAGKINGTSVSTPQTWENFIINEQTIGLETIGSRTKSYSLQIFNIKYKNLINRLTKTLHQEQQTFASLNHNKASLQASPLLKGKQYSQMIQVLNLSQEFHNGQTYILKSSQYQLLQLSCLNQSNNMIYQKQIVDWMLSYFLPINNQLNYSKLGQSRNLLYAGEGSMTKNRKSIWNKTHSSRYITNICQKLLIPGQSKTSFSQSILTFQTSLNGIKSLINQKQFQKAFLLIQQQLQSIGIWIGQGKQSSIRLMLKYYDAAMRLLGKRSINRSHQAVDYSLKIMKYVMKYKFSDQQKKYQIYAQKAYEAANVHYEHQYFQKALQLYDLTQVYIDKANSHRKKHSQYVHKNNKSYAYQQIQKSNKRLTILSIQLLKIYLKKSKIKLAMGKTSQTLQQCLQCLKRCQFYQMQLSSQPSPHHYTKNFNTQQFQQQNNYFSQQQNNFPLLLNKLQSMQMKSFQLIFRCYQITRDFYQMKKIIKLCCNKFIQDGFLGGYKNQLERVNSNGRNIEEYNINMKTAILEKILKFCWVCIVNQVSEEEKLHRQNRVNNRLANQKVNNNVNFNSYCLQGAFQQRNRAAQQNQQCLYNLEQLKQKLQALCKLYPKSRYNKLTLVSFIYQQILQSHSPPNQRNSPLRPQYYKRVGDREWNNSSRFNANAVSELITSNNMKKKEEQCNSMIFNKILDVVRQLASYSSTNGRHSRYNNGNVDYQNQQYSDQPQFQLDQFHQRRYSTFTNTNFIQPPQISPTRLTKNRLSSYSSSAKRNSSRQKSNNKIHQTNQFFSLKDQMDRKYMLIQALFGLCGRQFLIGQLDEVIYLSKLNNANNKKRDSYNNNRNSYNSRQGNGMDQRDTIHSNNYHRVFYQ